MPARLVYLMNVSLDLCIEAAPGEAGGGSWMRITEPLHRELNRIASEFSAAIEGRIIHETMEQFWPGAVDAADEPEVIREYARIWTHMPKVLVSRTRTHAEHHTRIVGGDDAIGEIARLRREGTGRVGVGGANLATQLLLAGLLDELVLVTHPVVLGRGRPLFDRLDAPLGLDLLDHSAFDEGVTIARYAVRSGG